MLQICKYFLEGTAEQIYLLDCLSKCSCDYLQSLLLAELTSSAS